jgi:calcium permeable stress-gated cation channel
MYDPVMYQRDRGELDWDQRSVALTSMDDPLSKSQYFAGASTTSLAGYDTYLNRGPNMAQQDIELLRMDPLQEPLLRPASSMTFQQQQGSASRQSLNISSPPSPYYHNNASTVSREAPLHRPQERSYSPSPTYISSEALPSSQQQYFESMQHQGRSSSNSLQFPVQSPTPRPYSPQQHARQNSGNVLASSQLRNQTSSPQAPRGQPSGPQIYTSQLRPSEPDDFNTAGRGVPRRH